MALLLHEAAVDFDVVAHIGYFKNIDLSHKGLYVVQISLAYGEQDNNVKDRYATTTNLISPAGLFSAPSTLESSVIQQLIPSCPMHHICQVDDEQKLFRTRSIVIRYRDEKHELNEGVFWRYTLPKVDLRTVSASPIDNIDTNDELPPYQCDELLTMKFELLYTPLLETEHGHADGRSQNQADLMSDIENFLPSNDVPLDIVATQTVAIKLASSGLHEYIPIRFECPRFIDLDCMVHCCMTAVRYSEITWTAIANRNEETAPAVGNSSTSDNELSNAQLKNCIDNGDVDDFPTALTETTSSEEIFDEAIALSEPVSRPTEERLSGLDYSPSRNHSPYSTTIHITGKPLIPPPPPSSSSTIFDHVIRRFSFTVSKPNPSKELQQQLTAQSTKPTTSGITNRTNLPIVEEFKNNNPQKKRLDVPTDLSLLPHGRVPSPLSMNNGRKLLFRSYSCPVVNNFSYAAEGIENVLSSIPTTYTESQIKPRSLTADCLLTVKEFSILDELYSAPSDEEVLHILRDYIDRTNVQLALRWSTFMSACKRSLPQVCHLMKDKYAQSIRLLWRRQLLVQTKSVNEWERMIASEDQELMSIMERKIAAEIKRLAKRSIAYSTLKPNQAEFTAPRVYDMNTYNAMDKLPFAVLQQYVNLSLAESSASTDSDRGGLVGTARLVRGGELLGLHDIGSSLFPRDRVDVSRFPLVLPISIDERTVESFFHSSTAAAATAQTVTEKDSIKEAYLFSTPERKSVSNPRDDESTSSSNNALRKGAAIFSPSGGSSMNGVGKVLDISMVSPIKKTAGVFSPRANGVANEAHGDGKDSDGPVHLIVLQHGFLGCSYDMRLLQNAMKVELPPNTQILCAKANEEHTQDSIAQMGKRLAFEISRYCQDKCPSLLKPFSKGRVSFLGHSMGGLIIRYCLQESSMKVIAQKLYSYISLATPHLGTLFSDSQIVSTGMWALFQYKKCKALKELVLEDGVHGKIRKSLLFKLSQNGVLKLFQKIILVSSPKDQYVPSYSARVQVTPKVVADATVGPIVAEMGENILRGVDCKQLVRVIVDNNVGEGINVNTVIGRAAHISYLENPIVATQIVLSLYPYLV